MTSNDDRNHVHKPEPPKAGARRGRSVAVDDPIQRAIGEKLKAVYDEIASEPVPEKFSELLRRLEDQERQEK